MTFKEMLGDLAKTVLVEGSRIAARAAHAGVDSALKDTQEVSGEFHKRVKHVRTKLKKNIDAVASEYLSDEES